MSEPDVTVRSDSLFVSSNTPPSRAEKRLAVAFAVRNSGCFSCHRSLRGCRPYPIPGFVLAFSAAMFVCDSIAAILLFAQFVVLRSLGLLIIANGYVLTALVLIPYTLTFPGIFGPEPVIGGLQSTAFLYTDMALRLSLICYRLRSAKGRKRSAQIVLAAWGAGSDNRQYRFDRGHCRLVA